MTEVWCLLLSILYSVIGFVYILQAKILTPSFCECWIISPPCPAFTDACYRVFLHYYIKEGDALNVGPKCNVTKLAACISCINMPIMERILPWNLRKPTEGRLCTSWRAKSTWCTHKTSESFSDPRHPPDGPPPASLWRLCENNYAALIKLSQCSNFPVAVNIILALPHTSLVIIW